MASSHEKALGKKMVKIKLGKKAVNEFAYRMTDHKGNELKSGGNQKGLEKLRKAN